MSTEIKTTEVTIMPKGTGIEYILSLPPADLLEESALHLRRVLSGHSRERVWTDSYGSETYFYVQGATPSPGYPNFTLKCISFHYNKDYPVAVQYGLKGAENYAIVRDGYEFLYALQSALESGGMKFKIGINTKRQKDKKETCNVNETRSYQY